MGLPIIALGAVWLAKKIISVLSFGSALTVFNGLIAVAKVALVASYVVLATFIFNRIIDLFTQVNEIIQSPSADSAVAWSFQVVASMGILDAFIDVWSLFSSPVLGLLVIFLSKKSLKILEHSKQSVHDAMMATK